LPIPAGQDRSFEHIFAAFDPDLGIIDLGHVDQGLQISFAEWNRSRGHILTHAATELFQPRWIDPDGLR
jgi:hypothetical protein